MDKIYTPLSATTTSTEPAISQLFEINNTTFSSTDYDLFDSILGGICICTQGEASFLFDQKRCDIKQGDLCVFFPHMLLQIENRSDDFKAYCIASQDDLSEEIHFSSASSIFLFIRENPCITLHKQHFERIIAYCKLFLKIDKSNHPYRNEMVRHLLSIIYYDIVDSYQHGQPLVSHTRTRQEMIFREFIELVSQHYLTQREIGFYADQLCLTPKYLSSIVRHATGQSAAWWISQVVITHAKSLLKKNSRLSIQQISGMLNFANPSFFGQYFKRCVGVTPKEFRRKRY
jgi:AraC-like DNA-binding protein